MNKLSPWVGLLFCVGVPKFREYVGSFGGGFVGKTNYKAQR
jgi:hypothetical protein